MTRTARTLMVFASPLAGDAPPASANMPKKVCENWVRDNHCPYGDRCLFAHPPQNAQKRTVCPPAKVACAPATPVKQVFVSPLGFNNEFHKVLPKIDIAQKAKEAASFEKCSSLANPLSESITSNNVCSNGSMSSGQSSCSPSESISASSGRRPLRPARALPKARNVRRISVTSDSVEGERSSPMQSIQRTSSGFGIVPSSRTPNAHTC